MANTVRIKRGNSADLEKLTLLPGELAVALDTQELFIGDAEGTKQIVKAAANGEVETASKLGIARNISLTGAATGSALFDGSKDIEIALALANSGVAAGTYTKVTVDEKGSVTTGATLVKEDLPTIAVEDIEGLETALEGKATVESVETLTETVGTKANASTVNTLTQRVSTVEHNTNQMSDDISDLNTLVDTKADKDSLSAYVTVSGGFEYTYAGGGTATGQGGQSVKISSDVLTADEIIGATIVENNKGTKTTATVTAVTDHNGYFIPVADGLTAQVNVVYDSSSTSLFPENGIYFVDLTAAMGLAIYVESLSKAGAQTITGEKDFTGGLKKDGIEVATIEDINTLSETVETKASSSDLTSAIETVNEALETAQTELEAAIEAKDSLPTQTNNDGKFLTTNGTAASWENIAISDVTNLQTELTTLTNNVNAKAATSYVNDELAKKANLSDFNTLSTTVEGKADKATTLAGYGIDNAYTKSEIDTELGKKADSSTVTDLAETVAEKATKATTLAGYGIENAYTKTEVDGMVAGTFHFKGEKASLAELEALTDKKEGDVYQVGEKEYAYNGTAWVELGFNIDLSAYAKTADVASTYATIATVNGKADKATTLAGYGITDAYTKSEVNNIQSSLQESIATKANSADVYTQTQVNNLLSAKLDANSVIDGGTF